MNPSAAFATVFVDELIRNELEWLKDDDPTVPPALPICSMAVARRRMALPARSRAPHPLPLHVHSTSRAGGAQLPNLESRRARPGAAVERKAAAP